MITFTFSNEQWIREDKANVCKEIRQYINELKEIDATLDNILDYVLLDIPGNQEEILLSDLNAYHNPIAKDLMGYVLTEWYYVQRTEQVLQNMKGE